MRAIVPTLLAFLLSGIVQAEHRISATGKQESI
jgi:hypothetical protein